MSGDYSFLSGPLRLSMLLAAEGKHEAAKAAFARYTKETMSHVRQPDDADERGADADQLPRADV